MLDIKNVDIKIDNEVFQKIISFLKQTWLGIPRWLRNVLIVTVFMGGMYYLYNRIVISYDIEDLQTEVSTLNTRYGTTVFYDRYVYDINNVLTSVKTIEHQLDVIFNEQIECMGAFAEFVKNTKPNDPILKMLESKK